MQPINRRDFLKISGAAIIGAGLAGAGLRWIEDQSFAAKNLETPAGARNVVFIVLDTVRSKSLSLLGYNRETTPNLVRLAKSGVMFTRAIAPASWTLQSHASMFTGHHAFELSADWNKALDKTYPTLAEAFRDAGYDTAGFVANYYYLGPYYGLSRGFQHYESFRITPGRAFFSTSAGYKTYFKHTALSKFERNNSYGRKNAAMLHEDFINWLDNREQDRPFFAFLNFIDAHIPYLPPGEYVSRFTRNKPLGFIPPDKTKRRDPAVIQSLRDAYDGAVAYLDDQVGQLYDNLNSRNLIENTVVIITSDHGEQFGEHDLLDHGNSSYLVLLHVPLLILHPTAAPVTQVDNPVGMRDLAATIVDMANFKAPEKFPGETLARYWNGSVLPESYIRSDSINSNFGGVGSAGFGKVISLVKERYHYLAYVDGKEELYDFIHDADEVVNLIKDNRTKTELEAFRLASKSIL